MLWMAYAPGGVKGLSNQILISKCVNIFQFNKIYIKLNGEFSKNQKGVQFIKIMYFVCLNVNFKVTFK